MKRTFQAGINGRVYNVEEDAYNLLRDYLTQLRNAFPAEEGEEIVSDIEARISEHFDTIVSVDGREVITNEDINRVITIMGRPEELQDEADEIGGDNAGDRRAAGGSTPPPPPASFVADGKDPIPAPAAIHKKLFRDIRHKVFGGVLAGLGQYLDWDVTMLRLLVVIATVALCGWSLFWTVILCYMIAWMVIPPANTPLRIIEMKGQPVTVNTVGQTVIDTAMPPEVPLPSEGNSFTRTINSAFGVIGRVLLVLLGILSGIGAFVMAIMAMVTIVGMVVVNIPGGTGVLDIFSVPEVQPYIGGWMWTLTFIAIMLPLLCLTWLGMTSLFRTPRMSLPTAVTLLVIEALLIVGAVVLRGFLY